MRSPSSFSFLWRFLQPRKTQGLMESGGMEGRVGPQNPPPSSFSPPSCCTCGRQVVAASTLLPHAQTPWMSQTQGLGLLAHLSEQVGLSSRRVDRGSGAQPSAQGPSGLRAGSWLLQAPRLARPSS